MFEIISIPSTLSRTIWPLIVVAVDRVRLHAMAEIAWLVKRAVIVTRSRHLHKVIRPHGFVRRQIRGGRKGGGECRRQIAKTVKAIEPLVGAVTMQSYEKSSIVPSVFRSHPTKQCILVAGPVHTAARHGANHLLRPLRKAF